MQRGSLRRILVAVSLAALLPTMLLLGVLVHQSYETAREQAMSQLRSFTYGLSSQYSLVISRSSDLLSQLGAVDQVASGSTEVCQAWLRQNMPEAPWLNGVFRIAPDGTVTCSTRPRLVGARMDVSFDPKATQQYNDLMISHVRESNSTGKVVFPMYRTFWGIEQPYRLMITLNAAWFEARFKEAGAYDSTRFFLINEDGRIMLSYPNPIETANAKVPTFRKTVAPKQDPIVHPIPKSLNGPEKLAASVSLQKFKNGRNLYMSISADPDAMFADAARVLTTGFSALVLGLFCTLLALLLVFRQLIAAPIEGIVRHVAKLSTDEDADLDAQFQNGPRELREVAEAARKMAQEIRANAANFERATLSLERAEEVANMGHWHFDVAGQGLRWSDGVYRLHGVSPETFTPTLANAIEFYHPADRDDVRNAIEDSMRDGKPFDFEKRIVRASDAQSLYVRSKGLVSFNSDGVPVSVFGIIIDIDAPKQAQRELSRAQQAAQTLADTRAKLLSTVSHEIKTPLGAMLELLRGLKQAPHGEETQKQLGLLDATGQMLFAVINDLLDGAGASANALRLVEAPVDLREHIAACASTFECAYAGSGVTLYVDVAPDVPKTVLVDGQRLRQVLFNLLSNALKHTARGCVNVDVRHVKGDEIAISVRDTGSGMTPQEVERLFQPFEQAGESRSKRGTGLGLSIVKTLLGLMDGRIDVSSVPGHGSTFTIYLPNKKSEAEPVRKETSIVSAGAHHPILVVEDNPVNQKLLTSFLSRRGYSYVVHGDGQSAMEWLLSLDADDSHGHPSVALVDINMPRLDGLGLSEFIRNQWGGNSDLPIYLVTAEFMADHDDVLTRLSINGFVTKPIDFSQLEGLIERHAKPQTQAA